ncbi:hypothetical protein AXF42_Ash015468 [Apostasia shenzhenica]|uniref:MULE transposase domain-containing protein n=1 Tax=Apostasia shenzhenica TaxID=1088818 RepID=A0A2H9ZSB0_9ASPA|nr:hypothetical protein AXF42_Ash015468 [Apostasia shenzhenica]
MRHFFWANIVTLLIAVWIDANNGVFPLAFGAVESENNDSWDWFLTKMHDLMEPVRTRQDLYIINDKHCDLLRDVPAILPHAAHRHCLHYLRENFKKVLWTLDIQAVKCMCDKMYTTCTTDICVIS